MRQAFDWKPVPVDVALRALAISSVVYHHAHLGRASEFGLFGGMAFLLLLSGMNLSRFALAAADPGEIRRALLMFARRILWPSLCLVLVYFAYTQRFNILELFFVRAWRSPNRIANFPVWYCQMILQILLGLYLLYWIPPVAEVMVRRPLATVTSIFLIGLTSRAFVPLYWSTDHLLNHLAHYHLWNFALGAVIFFLISDCRQPWKRWVASAAVLVSAVIAFPMDTLQFWWLLAGGQALVFLGTIRLPVVLAQPVMIVSGATFTIFLLHLTWFDIAQAAFHYFAGASASMNVKLVFLAGLLLSTLCWVGLTAAERAYRIETNNRRRTVLAAD